MGSCMKSIFWTCYQWEWECFFFFNVNTCHCSKHSMKVPKYFSEKKNYTHRKKFIIEWMNVEVSMNFLTKHVKRAFNQRLLNWWIQYSFFFQISPTLFSCPFRLLRRLHRRLELKQNSPKSVESMAAHFAYLIFPRNYHRVLTDREWFLARINKICP